MQVTPQELDLLARLVQRLCGVVLDSSKGYLIESRLSHLATKYGCNNFREFSQKVEFGSDPRLRSELIDAITTQETLFYRDGSPFQALQFRVIPDLIDLKSKTAFPRRLRVWSAACSTGQEPYSIAMVLAEVLPNFRQWDVQILATDISEAALAQAAAGRYGRMEVQRGLPTDLLSKHFVADGAGWRVRDELKRIVQFSQRNLLEPFTSLGPFDVIFCRNVAIYFSPAVRRSLFLRLSDRLTTEGYLFVGSSESLTDVGPQFAPQHHCHGTFYQPNQSLQPAPVLSG